MDGRNYTFKAVRTYVEVAHILSARGEPITPGGVFMAEKSALRKLREHPEMLALLAERSGGER